MTKKYLGSHVELSDDAEYIVEGEGTILFHLDSGGLLEEHDVIFVLELKKNFISVSSIDERGFAILFKKGHVLIHSKGFIPNTTMSIGVREGKIYRLEGMHIHGYKRIFDHGSMSVV
jgi:hypothetical protein